MRHHARRQHIALKYFGITAKAGDALLNPRAPRIVQTNDRRPDLHRHVHDLADFLRMTFGQRSAEHGEVLAKDEHQPPVDRARPRHHAVAGNDLVSHAEIDAVMLDIHVEFLKRPGIEQHVEPLARGQLALGVLRVDPLLPAAHARSPPLCLKLIDDGLHGCSF